MTSHTRNKPQTRTIVFCNQKGGVGKTTTCHHFADAARRAGLKVLLVDADPQGNLTTAIAGDTIPEDQVGLADVLSAQTKLNLDEVIVSTQWPNVDLVPTTGEGLAVVSSELIVTTTGREFKLRKALDRHLEQLGERTYDLVLIDCPPAIDQLMINALVAATDVLPITHAKLWSLDGLGRLVQNIREVTADYNQQLSIAGIVINQYEKTINTSQQRKRELVEAAKELGLGVFEPSIPKRTMIAETAENGGSLTEISGEDAARLAQIYDNYISRLMKEGT